MSEGTDHKSVCYDDEKRFGFIIGLNPVTVSESRVLQSSLHALLDVFGENLHDAIILFAAIGGMTGVLRQRDDGYSKDIEPMTKALGDIAVAVNSFLLAMDEVSDLIEADYTKLAK